MLINDSVTTKNPELLDQSTPKNKKEQEEFKFEPKSEKINEKSTIKEKILPDHLLPFKLIDIDEFTKNQMITSNCIIPHF